MNGLIKTGSGTPPLRPLRGEKGFTLIELIAVLVVITVLATVLLQRGSSNSAEVAAELGILKNHLRFAQALAMNNNTATWSVNLSTSGYQLWRDGATAPMNLPGENSATHNFNPNVSLTPGNLLLTYDEWGSPGAADVTLTLNSGAYASSLTIIRFTGLIP